MQLGGFPVGFGFILLYNSMNNYLVDSYQHQVSFAGHNTLAETFAYYPELFRRQLQR